jgi:hypothetical protein
VVGFASRCRDADDGGVPRDRLDAESPYVVGFASRCRDGERALLLRVDSSTQEVNNSTRPARGDRLPPD